MPTSPKPSTSNPHYNTPTVQLQKEWEYLTTVKTSSENEIVVTTMELDKTLCFRAETTVPFSAQFIYSILKDVRGRPKWDPNCQQIKVMSLLGVGLGKSRSGYRTELRQH